MTDEKMNELIAKNHKTLLKRILVYPLSRPKDIFIIYKREFDRVILGSKGIPVGRSIGGVL